VEITAPKESAELLNLEAVHFTWKMSWKRWDYQAYSEEMPQGFAERSPVVFAVKYSPDEGNTWYFAQDNTPTALGEPPPQRLGLSAHDYDWDLRDKKGNYVVRVEGFRSEIPLHYAFHQVGVSVKRGGKK
jgi:hypothetical protein